MVNRKKRLDVVIQEQHPTLSKTFIQSLIMQGKVTVEGHVVTKPGTQIRTDVHLEIDLHEPKYVSRAGFKLEKALDHFDIDVEGLVVLDAGLSTGGFTDCLLQHGTKKVYGIDVGYGQVHEKIRNDPRVVVMERTNLRYLDALPEKVDLATLDLSFISVLKVLDVIKKLLKETGKLIVLIKPQFEAAKELVGKGGIIKDPKIHEKVINKVTEKIKGHGFELMGVIDSPIEGTMGNKEFLAYFNVNST